MSWHYLREGAEVSSAESSVVLKQFAPSKSKNTPAGCYLPGKEMDTFRASRYGMISKLLTDGLGEIVLTSLRGGFPCQDISAAGKGAGITGTRSGLIFEMLRIIAEVRPRFILAENSPILRTKGLGIILSELAEVGYDAKWGVLGAWHVGAPHMRNRLWIVANDNRRRRGGPEKREMELPGRAEIIGAGNDISDGEGVGCHERGEFNPLGDQTLRSSDRWPTEPTVDRMVYGLADRVDRIRALGNGQVPAVVKLVWDTLRGLV